VSVSHDDAPELEAFIANYRRSRTTEHRLNFKRI
jgi:hypothetical protein